jgi:hypothetical protein
MISLDWGDEPANGLLKLGGGIAIINAMMLGIDYCFKEQYNSLTVKPIKFEKEKISSAIEHEKNIHYREFSNKKTEQSINAINDIVLFGFNKRVQKVYHDWMSKNNNSIDWNEWARRNPSIARDICLEAEYFYGEGLILPRSWDAIIAEWKKANSCRCENDDGKYRPKIIDEPKTGPIGIAELGFKDKINRL